MFNQLLRLNNESLEDTQTDICPCNWDNLQSRNSWNLIQVRLFHSFFLFLNPQKKIAQKLFKKDDRNWDRAARISDQTLPVCLMAAGETHRHIILLFFGVLSSDPAIGGCNIEQ